MLKKYILIRYDADGRSIERNDEIGISRFEFYSFSSAIMAMEFAITRSEMTNCAKLYRRRRSGGYKWIATYFRGGEHLSALGE